MNLRKDHYRTERARLTISYDTRPNQNQKVGPVRQLWGIWTDRGTSRRWQSGSWPTDQGLVAAARLAATRVESSSGTVSVAPPYHISADDESAIARGRADSRFTGPRPPTVTLCLAPPALNEILSADDRPARHYRRRRGGPPGLGRDATTKRPHSISSSTSTCHDGRPACIPLCGRRRRPLFSSPTPGYVLRAPDRRLPSGASPIFLGLAFDFSHTPFYRKSNNLKPKTI